MILARILDVVATLVFGAGRCEVCGERHRNLPAHKAIDHADLPD